MISALAWLPKGVAKAVPTVAEPSPEELAEMHKHLAAEAKAAEDDDEGSGTNSDEDEDAGMDSEEEGAGGAVDATAAVAKARKVAASIASNRSAGGASTSGAGKKGSDELEAAMRELDMDHYDDSDDEGAVINRVLGTSGRARLDYAPGEADPFLTLDANDDGDDDDSEVEDYTLRPTDLIVLAAKNEDDVSSLEVWVYEEAELLGGEANLYVHHDVLLPAFPLCVAWLDCDPRGSTDRRNLVAIGTLEPAIEIWDLDVVDEVEPLVCLGGLAVAPEPSAPEAGESQADKKKKNKKKKKKAAKPGLLPGSHEDSVLGLSWNREYRNVLASASADGTVKVWDIVKGVCEHTLKCHTSKVQAVAWNPVESPVLLSGGFDRTACLSDARTPNGAPARWKLTGDVEALAWNPHDPTSFLVSQEDGVVVAFDARRGQGSAPLFRLAAHDKPTCSMSFCPTMPGLMATGSTDKKIKLWDVSGNAPSLVATQELGTGPVFAAAFCGDAPHLLAAAGAKGEVAVWDVRAHPAVAAKYPGLGRPVAPAGAAADGADED